MKNRNDISDLQQVIMDSYKRMADLSLDTMKPFLEGVVENFSSVNQSFAKTKIPGLAIPAINPKSSTCCPPETECPPHCIASITRHAMTGERIIVPFLVRNRCSSEKKYRIGIRELKDEDGNMAPSQPSLNKQTVTLAPGSGERVDMEVDLKSFKAGSIYSTEIVLREKDINQNICFKLVVKGSSEIVEVSPYDEKKYKLKWLDWRSHYYCEPQIKKSREAQVSGSEQQTIRSNNPNEVK